MQLLKAARKRQFDARCGKLRYSRALEEKERDGKREKEREGEKKKQGKTKEKVGGDAKISRRKIGKKRKSYTVPSDEQRRNIKNEGNKKNSKGRYAKGGGNVSGA